MCVCAQSCLILSDPMDCSQPGSSLCPWDFPGKNTGMGCHFLLQGILSIQQLILHFLCLLHWQKNSLPLHHLGSPHINIFGYKYWWLGEVQFLEQDISITCELKRARYSNPSVHDVEPEKSKIVFLIHTHSLSASPYFPHHILPPKDLNKEKNFLISSNSFQYKGVCL